MSETDVPRQGSAVTPPLVRQWPLGIGEILGVLMIAGVFVVARARPPALWGIHLGGFLAPPLHAVVTAAAILVALGARPMGRRLADLRIPAPWMFPILAALAATFWFLRERFFYLGDAQPMLQFYEWESVDLEGHAFLTTAVNYNLFRALKGATGARAQDVIAATSVAAGLLFVIATLWATRRIGASTAADGSRTSGTAIARALLLTSGAMAIAFGYVENYTFVLPALVLFLGAGADTAAGRRGLLFPFVALVVAMLFHFVGFTMLPAFAYLVWRVARSERSARAVVVGAALLLGLIACVAGLGSYRAIPRFASRASAGTCSSSLATRSSARSRFCLLAIFPRSGISCSSCSRRHCLFLSSDWLRAPRDKRCAPPILRFSGSPR